MEPEWMRKMRDFFDEPIDENDCDVEIYCEEDKLAEREFIRAVFVEPLVTR